MRLAFLNAVAASIAAAELPGVPAPEASYRPLVALKALATASLQIVPAGRVSETSTRGKDEDRWSVFVALQKKVDTSDTAAVDAMLALGESVWDHLRRRDIRVAGVRYVWQSQETVAGADAGYAPEHIDTLRVVSCIYRVTYEAMT